MLSTTTKMPCWWAIVATFLMSTSVRVGFDGDSIQISFVWGVMSSAMSSSMDMVKVTFTSWVAATFVK